MHLSDCDFAIAMEWRKKLHKAIEPFRASGHKTSDAVVIISLFPGSQAWPLKKITHELPALFKVSGVMITEAETLDKEGLEVVEAATFPGYVKCERCFNYHVWPGIHDNLCLRCAVVMLRCWPDHSETPAIQESINNIPWMAKAMTPFGLEQPMEDIELNVLYFMRKYESG